MQSNTAQKQGEQHGKRATLWRCHDYRHSCRLDMARDRSTTIWAGYSLIRYLFAALLAADQRHDTLLSST
jgi:hypothetical protein